MYDLSFDKCVCMWPAPHYGTFPIPSKLPCGLFPASPSPATLGPPRACFLWLRLEFNLNGIIQYVLFRIWFLSLNVEFFEIHPSCCVDQKLLFISGWCCVVWTGPSLFIHSAGDGLWAVGSFESLRIKLLWIFLYKSCMFLFLFGKCLVVELRGHMCE